LRILLGITGGIAAYKATGLIRAFQALGHTVEVLPTENALRFVGKTTLEALSGKNIDIDMYNDVAQVRHVEIGQQADLIVIAPATASFLSRLATGLADDLLTNAILASRAPIVVCPAMHTEMWENPATQNNVSVLQDRGIRVMPPAVGRLTGPDSGAGRMPEVQDIVSFSLMMELSGKTVVVTAGGTREPIDAVRFIGNRSSGRMGIEIAKAARDAGAHVILIAANLDETVQGVEVLHVSSVDELERAMNRTCDAIVMAAAVSDYRVQNPHSGKLSRSEGLELSLTPTKDLIADYVAEHKNVFAVAFALAEDGKGLEIAAREKLAKKGVHLVIGNTTEALGSDHADVILVDQDQTQTASGAKQVIAKLITQRIIEHFRP
jgi:phosphopantothenoylcysteine decarboxylase / phosphopantothenate---cysteine ligase